MGSVLDFGLSGSVLEFVLYRPIGRRRKATSRNWSRMRMQVLRSAPSRPDRTAVKSQEPTPTIQCQELTPTLDPDLRPCGDMHERTCFSPRSPLLPLRGSGTARMHRVHAAGLHGLRPSRPLQRHHAPRSHRHERLLLLLQVPGHLPRYSQAVAAPGRPRALAEDRLLPGASACGQVPSRADGATSGDANLWMGCGKPAHRSGRRMVYLLN